MNTKFDELTKGLARSGTRRESFNRLGVGFAGIVLVWLFAVQGHAADLYADASVNANGDGSGARPYWRITDAVEHARVLRQTAAIPVSERIVIHVAAGTYLGSKETPVLNHNPRYEALPILLNVPNLTLAGSTVLTADARGLPVGMVPGTETLLATEDNYTDTGKSLILLSRSTDGGVGDDVTVSGFHLDSLNSHPQSGAAIRLDRVSRFAISQNLMTRGGFGCYATRASGSVEGNLITGGFSGVVAKGGSREHPSQCFIVGNRRVAGLSSGFVIEADGLAPQIDVGANRVELEPLPVAEVRDDPPFTTEATVVGNECSDNGGTGMKCFMYSPSIKPINPLVSSGTVVPRLTVMAAGNTFSRNRTYGVVVDANDALRSINHPLTGQFQGEFQNNTLADNMPAAAMFTFTAVAVSLGNASLKDIKYLQQATYDITDLDGELVGYDYDNPVTDPFDGSVLNNTLIVNGTIIPPGTKITP
ncbi:MAG TPA: hypothetical protein VJA21_25675 [Verrucomicrobiae bacterium]